MFHWTEVVYCIATYYFTERERAVSQGCYTVSTLESDTGTGAEQGLCRCAGVHGTVAIVERCAGTVPGGCGAQRSVSRSRCRPGASDPPAARSPHYHARTLRPAQCVLAPTPRCSTHSSSIRQIVCYVCRTRSLVSSVSFCTGAAAPCAPTQGHS